MSYEIRKRTPEEENAQSVLQVMLEDEVWLSDLALERIPFEWYAQEFLVPKEEKKVRLTLYVDETVARAFKRHVNWQQRMRGCLRAFVRAEQAGLLKRSKDYRKAYNNWRRKEREQKMKRLNKE